jgi:hypothetical protein
LLALGRRPGAAGGLELLHQLAHLYTAKIVPAVIITL